MVGIFSTYLILTRARVLAGENAFEGLLAKETSFLVNNVLFLGLAFATFWGTIFPIVSEAVTGNKVTVGPPFYNQVNGPIFIGVIVLTGICPLIAWRRSSLAKLGRNLLIPTLVWLGAFISFLVYLKRPAVAIAYGTVAFVAVSIFSDLIKEVRVRMSFHPEEWLLRSIWKLMRVRARKYGGYMIHLGVIMMALGVVTSTSFKRETTVSLRPGETARFAGFSFRYKGMKLTDVPGAMVANGELLVTRAGRGNRTSNTTRKWEIRPAKIHYAQTEQPHTEVDILRFGFDDLYAILAGYKAADGGKEEEGKAYATFKLLYHPGISLIWLGFYIILVAGIFCLIGPLRSRQEKSS
jgi:cytochrome c-type biogenesis protein CcmF